MADDQLKVLLMEQQWWAQRGQGFEEHCESCSCAPSDLRPAYDCTGGRSCLPHAAAVGSPSCLLACMINFSTGQHQLVPPLPLVPSPAAGEAWLWSRDGSSYASAAAHFAHLLNERCWGLTPAGSGFAGLAAMHAEQHAPFWPHGLARTTSSVGQHV
jgi:hypothetical protein